MAKTKDLDYHWKTLVLELASTVHLLVAETQGLHAPPSIYVIAGRLMNNSLVHCLRDVGRPPDLLLADQLAEDQEEFRATLNPDAECQCGRKGCPSLPMADPKEVKLLAASNPDEKRLV